MADNNDIFAPPSNDELKKTELLVQPTEEERQAIIKFIGDAPKSSPSEAFLRGAEQGATFGFAEEIGAPFGAIPETLTTEPQSGENKIDQLQRLYKEYRDAERQKFKQAEEEYPGESLAGNMAGGFVLPGGMLSKGVKGLKGLQAVKQGAKVGFGAGALTGAGTSEADLTDVSQNPQVLGEFGEDVLTGAEYGTVLGGSIPPIATGAKKLATGVKNVGKLALEELVGPTAEAFKQGLRGRMLVGEPARRQLEKQVEEFAKDVGPSVVSRGSQLAKLKNKIIQRAEKQGVKLDETLVDDYLQKFSEKQVESNLPRTQKEYQELQNILKTAKEGPEIRQIRKEALPTSKSKIKSIEELKIAEQKAIESGVDPNDIETVFENVDVPGKQAAIVRQTLYDQDGNVKGYKKLASRLIDEQDLGPQFKEVTETARSGGRDLTNPKELEQLRKDIQTKSMLGDESFKTPEVQKMATEATTGARDIIREKLPVLKTVDARISALNKAAQTLGVNDIHELTDAKILDKFSSMIRRQESSGEGAIKARRMTEDFLTYLKDGDPKLAKRIGPKIQDLATQSDIAQAAGRQVYIPRPLATAEAYAVKGGNLAGYGIRQMTPDVMVNIADKLKQAVKPGAQQLSQVLETAAQKDKRGRDAIMFTIMQNPKYRELLRDSQEENTEEQP